MQILIAGNLGGTNVGGSLFHAASELGHSAHVVEVRHAFAGGLAWRKLNWLLGHRPSSRARFNRMLISAAAKRCPNLVLTTGISPVTDITLRHLRSNNIRLVSYLTDDPWNAAQRSRSFFRSLPYYDVVFSPRCANIAELKTICRRVKYLPFGYDPQFAFPIDVPIETDAPEIVFVGGADRERAQTINRLITAGHRVEVYGSYWENYGIARGAIRGQGGPEIIRRATAVAKLALCLVRRANRDGHVMRTFEIAAIGACMIVEDTPEHRHILGETVAYFRDFAEMLGHVRDLLADAPRRAALAEAVRRRITSGSNTYKDRLASMLNAI